jgi:hypothetical protein
MIPTVKNAFDCGRLIDNFGAEPIGHLFAVSLMWRDPFGGGVPAEGGGMSVSSSKGREHGSAERTREAMFFRPCCVAKKNLVEVQPRLENRRRQKALFGRSAH